MTRMIRFWQDPVAVGRYQSGVCLHGHTLHSEECLSFLPRVLHHVPGAGAITARYQRAGVDFSRAYWTPPLTPPDALEVESQPIRKLGLRPLISLTDHDNIEAGMAIQPKANRSETPISVEWTVPFGRTILHLGVHHIPPGFEAAWLAAMKAHTLSPNTAGL